MLLYWLYCLSTQVGSVLYLLLGYYYDTEIRTYCLPTYQIDDDDQEEIRCDRVTSEREVCGIGRDTLLGIVKDVQKKGRWGA